ncbi:hypothetical protein ACFWNN_42430 [Lentzea sp. NPDC058450]|uniref:hypothetical protein n=1 Tax=Lentzea sp. NPDC058450 TaxID=3346505 RepID=UPI003655C729
MTALRTVLLAVTAVATLGTGVACVSTPALAGQNAAAQAEDRAVTRDQILARAQVWIDAGVPYSTTNRRDGYRTDCSGFVSHAWTASTGFTTRSLPSISHRITKDDLRPGDAVLRNPDLDGMGHVRLFTGWADAAKTVMRTYEQTSPTTVAREHTWSAVVAGGYLPYRYNNVIDNITSAPGRPPSGDAKAEIKPSGEVR